MQHPASQSPARELRAQREFSPLARQAEIDLDAERARQIERAFELAKDLLGGIGLAAILIAGLYLAAGFGGF